MSTNEQARALMMRHYQMIKNRHQSMMQRAGAEIGMPGDITKYWQPIQGKVDQPNARMTYDRSNATMS